MRAKMISVPIIGVGGGIGSGKSLVAGLFAVHGATILNLDHLSLTLSSKGKPIWVEIVKTFGPSFLDRKGEINRKKVGKVVFQNWKMLFLLNQKTHPILKNETKKFILRLGSSSSLVIDGAVLYEAGLVPLIDCLIFVEASREQRYSRLIQKGLSSHDARSRIQSQKFLNCLRRRSSIIIDNNTSPEELQKIVNLIYLLQIEKSSLLHKGRLG